MPNLTRRKLFTTALLFAGLLPTALSITGCPAPKTNEGGTTPTTTTTGDKPAPTTGETKKIKAGLVTDTGGINDRSFNTSAWEGLQEAQKTLGAEIKFQESKANGDYVSNLTRFAQAKYDVVFAVGFKMQDALKEVAPRFPDTKFAIIDGTAPDLPNCVSYQFKEEQGSFLAGALAGAVSKTGNVGFIGGEKFPLIEKFEYGYKAGVMSTNPKAKVVTGYVGAFNDPAKGRELALSQFGAGKVDIIYHAAGESGVGVINAAKDKGTGFYAIGVDKDQDGDAPGRVLTSMVKRVDVATFSVCDSVAKGTFKAGTTVLGVKDGGIGLSPMQYTKKDIPAPVLAKIDALKKDIVDGKLTPPATADEMKAFKAPEAK